jgi:hypothetical protein
MNRPSTSLDSCDSQVRQRLGDWSGHIRGCLNQTDVFVHLVRYEDLLADTPGVFGRALVFPGVHFQTEAGDWRRHLADEQVLRIKDAHAATMTSLGYELVTSRETAL